MGERSASDREGAGSSPASGPLNSSHAANPGYASLQLAKALTTAEEHADAATRQRSLQKAQKWTAVLQGMADGSLAIGSRTPLSSTPAWVTPEVVTGGFATGGMMAGGPLTEYEHQLHRRLHSSASEERRWALNTYFLSEHGLAELLERLDSGSYQINVPEEGALPAIAWLARDGQTDAARQLVDELLPFFDKLRFFPEFVDSPRRVGQRVFVQSVGQTISKLQNISPRPVLLAQQETLEVWTPLYDKVIALFLETVDGPHPTLTAAPQFAGENWSVEGGWPCRQFAADWAERGRSLLKQIERLRQSHRHSQRSTHRKSSLAQLLPLLQRCVANHHSLQGRDVGRIRVALARYHAKRGWPDSERCQEVRQRQATQARTPLFHQIAAAVLPRLNGYPTNGGIEVLAPITKPLTLDESAHCNVPAETPLPETIRRKIEQALWDTIDVLIQKGLITSGESLAKVLPQLTSGVRSAGIADPHLRSLYAAVYRAFRRRRSLLLLDLQSQVRLEELPWVASIERLRSENQSTQTVAQQTLQEIASLTLSSFPQAILPNKLLQELRALVKSAGLDLPLVDELAADIFMGRFSGTFVRSVHQAANILRGTIYALYYDIDCDELLKVQEPRKEERRGLFNQVRTSSSPSSSEPTLIDICSRRAGVSYENWQPAINGMLIEQQQILTTQNLAQLFAALDLQHTLQGQLLPMAQECLRWVCEELQREKLEWHAKLIKVKQAAYAWRQMLFFLSFASADDRSSFRGWAAEEFATQPKEFQIRFGRAMAGLDVALLGHPPESSGGKVFTGWAEKHHWLLWESPGDPLRRD